MADEQPDYTADRAGRDAPTHLRDLTRSDAESDIRRLEELWANSPGCSKAPWTRDELHERS